MKITRTDSGKFNIKKLTWRNYERLAYQVNDLAERFSQAPTVEDRIMGLVMLRLERRMAKAETYPLRDHYYRKDKISVSLEADEMLTLWHLYPCDMTDPLRSVLNLELPKYF